ncbi:FecR family protein [Dokdonia sinensis]|uniref:FecR family protein n=1 Tax=Dokdonia sinensis TaxID=2479847 RepID=A0A3M0FW38_9FLAO|nr:FecR family protein [Dokdonia sinensis]RMB56901.1 FecR family protein [Dokdonia sinensis]
MIKEILVSKWMDNTLSPQELEQFKQLPEYGDYMRLSDYAQAFRAPDFDANACFNSIESRKNLKKNSSKRWLSMVAVLAFLVAGAYFFTQASSSKEITTAIAQQETITLPDNSTVILNAMSSLAFNENTWDENRTVMLDGEAYFKVAKGSKFTVQTDKGTVSVLGTQFNVQERDKMFSVSTFEGLVRVETDNFTGNIGAGYGIFDYNGKTIKRELELQKTAPSWTEKISTFDSAPYSAVIAEMERQFDITIKASTVQTNELFTGSFTHTDLFQALENITIPMGLKFSVTGKVVKLEQE